MAIRINLDVMMAKRKMGLTELATSIEMGVGRGRIVVL